MCTMITAFPQTPNQVNQVGRVKGSICGVGGNREISCLLCCGSRLEQKQSVIQHKHSQRELLRMGKFVLPFIQRPKNLGGRVALPSGKFLRVRKVFARNPWNCNGEFPDPLENFQIVWIFSGLSGKFPDSLESFRRAWKVSRQSENFPESLKSFQRV